jgi:phospholipid/cholesterol/gamma-HCH transport system substrate-binding protein
VVARAAAGGALLTAVAVLAVLLLTSGSSYTLRLNFQDAGGLVNGNLVLIGPASVGTVNAITLTPDGQAQVEVSLNSTATPMHVGTVARVFENSLSGNANRYVVLEPGPRQAPEIPSGGLIGLDHTHAFVSLDQVFDAFNPLTRIGLRDFIRGQAASIQGRAQQAHQTLLYFAPALSTTSDFTKELVRDEPAFDGLLVQGAQAMTLLASRSQELTQLIANGNVATGAIARQAQALQSALQQFPSALTRSTTSFQGLNTTLDALDPLVNGLKQAVGPGGLPFVNFATDLRSFVNVSIPTVAQLNGLIHNPTGGGDLTKLFQQAPALADVAVKAFPRLIKQMNDSQAQLDTFREYTPDLVAAFSNLGQVGGYYDANGHYARTQPNFYAFNLDGANQLQARNPANRYNGLQKVRNRCPGSATQAPPDGSAPWQVPGCSLTAVPPGP